MADVLCPGCEIYFTQSVGQQVYCCQKCYDAHARDRSEHFAPWLEFVPEMTSEEYDIVAWADEQDTDEACEAADVVVRGRATLIREARERWHAGLVAAAEDEVVDEEVVDDSEAYKE